MLSTRGMGHQTASSEGSRRQGPPLAAAYSAEATPMLCTCHTSSGHATMGRSQGIPVAQSTASSRRSRPPCPTALPLAMKSASCCCPPIPDSSAAPSEGSAPTSHSSLCRPHWISCAIQPEPCAMEQSMNIHPKLVATALGPTSAGCLRI